MGAGTAVAASPSWSTGSGTWDDTTSANWAPAQVPVAGDSVTINRATATTVDFASGNFVGVGSNLLALTLGGTGASNVLQIGVGDTLRYTNAVNINSGDRKISVHEFGLSGSPTFSKCSLTIRYDDSAVPGLENQIAMSRWNGSSWTRVAATVDAANRRITASDLTALGRFSLTVNTSGTRICVQ